jgi:hypothetical protein
MDYSFDMLTATLEALIADRDYSPWSVNVAGWMQWAKLAKEII